ncbi:hypothetical protein NT695_002394 [Vibrio fluvialis]|nr:hypothetical protein [Vibrio fluvialis]
MSVKRSFSINIEPNQEGYEAKVDFDSYYTAKENYSRTITRTTKDQMELAVNDLIRSFPSHNTKVKKVSNFPMSSSSYTYKWFAVFGIIAMLLIGFVAYRYHSDVTSGNSLDNAATFFNNVGAPIVALMSYIALLYTLYQQNKAHEVSLEELALTRKELVDSTAAQKAQAKTLELQLVEAKSTAKSERFDSTFYSLLDQHNKIQSELAAYHINMQNDIKFIGEQFDDIHKCPYHCRYFRIVYQLLKFIAVESSKYEVLTDELFATKVNAREKFYSNIVRSMLTDDLLYKLACNCYSPKGESDSYYRYWQLIERYEFLEHLIVPNNIEDWGTGVKYLCKNVNVFDAYTEKAFANHIDLAKLRKQVEALKDKVKINEETETSVTPQFQLVESFDIVELNDVFFPPKDFRNIQITKSMYDARREKVESVINNICANYFQRFKQLKNGCVAFTFLETILVDDLNELLSKRAFSKKS